MTLIALLLLTVALADLARERASTHAGIVVGSAVALLAGLVTAWGLGVGFGWALAAAGIAIGWVAATTTTSSSQVGYLKLAILLVPLLVAWAWSPITIAGDSAIARWYTGLPYSFTETTDVTTFALAVAGVAALIETANIIVRTIVAAAPRLPAPAPAGEGAARDEAPARRPLFVRRGQTPGRAAPASHSGGIAPARPAELPLKGGRIIGPFERLFLFALVLAGQFTAIAALVAAKGVIRFPEISRDEPHGTKAEYFLVGSFASWATVGVIAVLVLSAT